MKDPRAKQEPKRASGRRDLLRWVIGLVVAVVAMWLLLRILDWQEVLQALRTADYSWVVLALVAIVGTFVSRTLRWQALLYHSDIRFQPAMTGLLIGQVVNLALPIMRSGDVARAFWANHRGSSGVSETLGSIALEKMWDLIALCACGLILLIAVPLPTWFAQSTWGTLLVVGVGILLLSLMLHWQEPLLRFAARLMARLPARWAAFVTPQLSQLIEALDALRDPGASASAGLWTAVTWSLGGLANWAVMQAFGVDSVLAAIFLLAALMLGGAVVPTPAGVGVYEGICVVSLGLFDVEPSIALAIGLVLHLIVIGPALIAAALLAMVNSITSAPERA